MSFICDKNRNIIRELIDLRVENGQDAPSWMENMCAYSGGFGGGRRGGGGGGGGYGGRDARQGMSRRQGNAAHGGGGFGGGGSRAARPGQLGLAFVTARVACLPPLPARPPRVLTLATGDSAPSRCCVFSSVRAFARLFHKPPRGSIAGVILSWPAAAPPVRDQTSTVVQRIQIRTERLPIRLPRQREAHTARSRRVTAPLLRARPPVRAGHAPSPPRWASPRRRRPRSST